MPLKILSFQYVYIMFILFHFCMHMRQFILLIIIIKKIFFIFITFYDQNMYMYNLFSIYNSNNKLN